jgi:hypothetical protein
MLVLFSASVWAQEGISSFDYLLLPHSARAAALGGDNVSIVERDVSLIYHNPAILVREMDKTVNVSYLAYIADIGIGNATFAKSIGENSGVWGVGVQYAGYGDMLETNENGDILGDLTAKDMCANVFYAHDLTYRFRGGITGKFFYSDYAHNTAVGVGVDLGLHYNNAGNGFSAGLVGKNIGRQIKAYEEQLAGLPWDVQLGMSYKLEHAPIRFSLTGTWKKNGIVGVDVLPSNSFWFGVGYNIKRGSDMSLVEGNRLGGFSAGAGVRVKSFDISCALGKYNISATSFMLSVSMNFSKTKL